MMRQLVVVAACVSVLGLAITPVSAEMKPWVREASADAHVVMGPETGDHSDVINTNYGSEEVGLTKWNGAHNWSRKLYARFDLSDVDKDVYPEASLQMTGVWDPGGNPGEHYLQVYALNDGDPGEGWGEDTITYANAPAKEGLYQMVNLFDPGRTTWLGEIGPYWRDGDTEIGTVYELSSPELLDAVKGDKTGSLTLAILQTPQSGWSPQWAMREHDTYAGPTLTLVPEPSSLLLGLIGLVMLLAGFRRRPRAA